MGYQKYVKNLYRNVGESFKDDEFTKMWNERARKWRRGRSVVRHEKPIRIDRARNLGYKAKQGFVVARSRVRRGSMRKPRHVRGRKPSKSGMRKITANKSIQRIAEERAQARYRNLEVLASYWLAEDGTYKWYEVILVDPSHPQITNDKHVGWITEKQHKNRVTRGLTSAGKKGRGQRKKGKGTEKTRPSLRSRGRLGK
ncbi:MAG TPA: 50S ribosomal protein L15e [Candidatus Altiarchaeales archaeon]|nr:50S ribosomal protein L15e [Candidatus Altiarchaeales archaeon]